MDPIASPADAWLSKPAYEKTVEAQYASSKVVGKEAPAMDMADGFLSCCQM